MKVCLSLLLLLAAAAVLVDARKHKLEIKVGVRIGVVGGGRWACVYSCPALPNTYWTRHPAYPNCPVTEGYRARPLCCVPGVDNNDKRGYFPISTFGFYRLGHLVVDVHKFRITPKDADQKFGFILEKIANPYTDTHPEKCRLLNLQHNDQLVQHVFFIFDLKNKQVYLNCSDDMSQLHVFNDTEKLGEIQKKEALAKFNDKYLFNQKVGVKVERRRRDASNDTPVDGTSITTTSATMKGASGDLYNQKCNDVKINMTKDGEYYSFKFVVYVALEKEEGLYNLNFHNCMNYGPRKIPSAIDMFLEIEEKNPDDNYLSAGEMPLPALYFMMALLFFLSACFWFFLLKKSRDPVFKIHYLMGVLVVIKSFSLLFHGVNYHMIQTHGVHMEAWAVMYYIMHLLKGALLFTVLALIGSGWAFIKHVLSSKERKIFIIIIPLQIIANVATIIVEETEKSNQEHAVWVELLFVLDFLCCGAILLPVVWSIRHLQEASQTDGKAAMNLRKLKLFRHFYIMIVCYIYFTRIIVYLLWITVPFQYEWLDDMFREMATYVFFVMTGYKFRPATNNPYFRVYDDEKEVEEVLTTTGLTEGITQVNQHSKRQSKDNVEVEVFEDDEEVNLLDTQESSHAFD
ncbi:Protein GPR107 [Chionoecetes opilio]|uniref:Protein GPR107 n=1 Tax=Chionoecetes opilio TaxID=41210 RepID=A0A8J4YCD2_CHIOP|nr:Protein GPR107 [Chionoecetes opilio]